MRSNWTGLETARRALQASQQAIDLTGRNVANANTRGYSRQAPSYAVTPPHNVPLGQGSGQIGTGLTDINIVRYRDEFLDQQYRQRAADLGAAETWTQMLDQVEQIWGEPGEAGVQSYLDRFHDSLQGLAARPSASDARRHLITTAQTLVSRVQDMNRQLQDLQSSLDTQFVTSAHEINNISKEVSELNAQIGLALASNVEPNDLRDKRDLLLDQLARLTGATWVHQADGRTNVYMGSKTLVVGNLATQIKIDQSDPSGMSALYWEGDNSAVIFKDGVMPALQEARDSVIPDQYMSYLQSLMGNLAREFNVLHAAGYYPAEPGQAAGTNTGQEFFTVTYLDASQTQADLKSLAVNIEPARVAAASDSATSQLDSGTAQKLVKVLDDKVITHTLTGAQPVSIMDFHRAVVGEIGIVNQRQRGAADAFELQLHQADQMRLGVSGVSLDEEMTRLIEFQNGYTAAARMVTVVDELMDVLINRMGLTGR